MRHSTIDKRLVVGIEQRAGSAVSHRERTTINIGRRREEISEHTLMHSRQTAVLLLVSCGHDAMLGRDPLSHTPQRRDFDLVDAIAPGVPLGQGWLIQPVS